MQPWELAVAVGNAIVRFSMSVVFVFTTYIIADYF